MKRKAKNKSSSIPAPIILVGLGIFLVIGALIWQNVSANTAARQGREVPIQAIERITLASSKAAFDAQTALFLDVRDSVSYQAGHIPGAVNIPIGTLETRAAELDPKQWIITYCT